MTIPGFSAETTVYRTSGHYRRPRYGPQAAGGGPIVPQAFPVLESLCAMECRGVCHGVCQRNPMGSRCRKCRTDCVHDCESGFLG